jgi:hypothetical protein
MGVQDVALLGTSPPLPPEDSQFQKANMRIKRDQGVPDCNLRPENKSDFPFLPDILPTKREYNRMILFVSAHLVVVLVLCGTLWVPRGGDGWVDRLVFASCSVIEALLRVVAASWWLYAASSKFALVFLEIDFVTLALVGLSSLFMPSLLGSCLQYQHASPPSTGGTSLSDAALGIFLSSSVGESLKLIGYMIPFALRQIRCSSHLLFAGTTAGALNLLYGDMFSGFKPESTSMWILIIVSLLNTLMFTLWTSMGTALLCQIVRNRLAIYWCPLVLLVPVIFHSCYLIAVFGEVLGWRWAVITIAYWIVSGVALKLSLAGTMSATDPRTGAFVSSASTAV